MFDALFRPGNFDKMLREINRSAEAMQWTSGPAPTNEVENLKRALNSANDTLRLVRELSSGNTDPLSKAICGIIIKEEAAIKSVLTEKK